MGRIVVVGSSMTDLITYVARMPAAGETLDADAFRMAPGGKGANQAVAAACLGSDVALVARVGDDAFGRAALEHFRERGIDTEHVTVVAGVASGVAPIFVEPNGENRILIVRGANATLRPEDVDRAAATIARSDVLLVQLEIPLDTVAAAIAAARAAGVPVVLNPAPAPPGVDLAPLRGATFLAPNESELATLIARPVATLDDVAAAARALRTQAAADVVIVTLGERGALVVGASSAEHVPAIAVHAVDTTGAGDAFIGSFAHAFVATRDTSAAVRLAVRYAADSVTGRGTQSSYATAAEFAAFRGALGEDDR